MKFRKKLRALYMRIPLLGDLKLLRESMAQLSHDVHVTRTLLSSYVTNRMVIGSERYAQPRRLLRYAHQVCSQNGEDGIISEVFRRIGTGKRVFVEIGVGDGTENNSAFLLACGWSGYWIDGNPAIQQRVDQWNAADPGCLQGLVTFVTRENATQLLRQMNVAVEMDLLSIDVDQNTYYVWEALSHYRPRLVVVEYNAALPPEVDWKVAYSADKVWDGTLNFGASLKALELLGRKLGYSLVGCNLTGVNAFFVRDDLARDFFEPPFTSENHFEPLRYALNHRDGHALSSLDRNGVG
jgi:hypothetical protein